MPSSCRAPGTLNDKMAGFYRSGYENSKGERVYLGTTQFEAADARRAFPCWDEVRIQCGHAFSFFFVM
jgi:aminopeptidase N